MDFGCYNALWSLWYMGKPETVYAHANHLRPETFPKVEDNADLILGYKNGVGIFEASWDLPRSYQDLEVYGLKGSVYMEQKAVTLQKGREKPHDARPHAARAGGVGADRLHGQPHPAEQADRGRNGNRYQCRRD